MTYLPILKKKSIEAPSSALVIISPQRGSSTVQFSGIGPSPQIFRQIFRQFSWASKGSGLLKKKIANSQAPTGRPLHRKAILQYRPPEDLDIQQFSGNTLTQ